MNLKLKKGNIRIGLFLISMIWINISNAATLMVTNTQDTGTGSLRFAIANSNYGDIVKISPSVLSSGSDTIHLESTIDITKGLFIKGTFNSKDTLYISGGDSVQIFDITITAFAPLYNIEMDSLILINGKGYYGGALEITMEHTTAIGTVTIRDCIFRNNSGEEGGAIGAYRNVTGGGPAATTKIKLINSAIENNKAAKNGGGIYVYMYSRGEEARVEIDVINSSIIGNKCKTSGGGIYARGYNWNTKGGYSYMNITGSSICKNSADINGGGIYSYAYDATGNFDATSQILLKTSTISDNKTISNGGGIYSYGKDLSYVEVINSTLVYNTCFVDGSGFYNTSPEEANFRLQSSIIALNSGNSSYNNNIFHKGDVKEDKRSYGYNIFENSSLTMTHFHGKNTNQFGVGATDLNLDSLKINTNGTYTRFPISPSAAIDSGSNWDTSAAQNGKLLGRRDVGSAESKSCTFIRLSSSASICSGENYNFNGKILDQAGIYYDTIIVSGNCDTIHSITLSVAPTVTPSIVVKVDPGSVIMTGTPTTFQATHINGGTSPTYNWLLNGVSQGLNDSIFSSSNLINGAKIECILTSSAQCPTTQDTSSIPITMIVHANNDDPCNAIELKVNEKCELAYFSNDNATNTQGVSPHKCLTNSGHDIWFKFTTNSAKDISLNTFAGTLSDAVVSIYEGSCSNLFELGCIDDDGNNKMPSGIISNQTASKTYYIRISGWSASSGSFAICLFQDKLTFQKDLANSENIISVFPNPVTSILNLSFTSPTKRKVLITNTLGKVVQTAEIYERENQIDISNLPCGIYQIGIYNNSELLKLSKILVTR